jgi:2,4-dienoyl-CoA reductase-like NADH-dependent reductase (Old Yellow Enzyme family)
MTLLATQTFPIGNDDRQGIPEEWEDEQPERFKKAVEAIHAAADKVCSSYDKLVRTARKKFLP